ncbi:uncharacterized protein A1O5_05660 [Cladophialophora psammophila CBS 110553]|uniref:C3H1-type domain-containing protein n=1 Tax=Cladophialophora psammophila CBS 110553 TaxID=1182543 RepID=W9X016_9EURO|nr:uncharacterized protein A1O5_05660 [Cladophialophora psammophila CBS 110553]EXJ70670.1 hypothetical protein A1O5_05660 [Cladophialophora psammophila CBS 110553]
MDILRKQYMELKKADEARNNLIETLFRKIDNMQKTMDRNAFIMVLIDGDNMYFLNELVRKGMAGGDEAAKLLRRAVFEYLRYDNDIKHDDKIVIRVYANLRGLSKLYSDMSILHTITAFSQFVLGFNKAHPLCDFIDAGNHKEAADSKLKENLSLNIYNVHCKRVLFGGSSDNAYASFLGSFLIDTDVSSRITLIQGLPFSPEFGNIRTKLKCTEFPDVFRNAPLSSERRLPRELEQWRTSAERTNGDLYATDLSTNENVIPVFEYPYRDEDGIDVSDTLSRNPSVSFTPSSSQIALPGERVAHTADDIEAALIKCTNERLRESPRALDFGVVKKRVEQALGLPSDLWASDEWFLKSKSIIKRAVENWVERTGNPPPLNATWMLARPPPRQGLLPSNIEGLSSNTVAYADQPPIPQLGAVYQNAEGRRIDVPVQLEADPALLSKLRERQPRLCNAHYLLASGCTNETCSYDHTATLTDDETRALLYLSRCQLCPQGSWCTSKTCVKGHICPNGRKCKHGSNCRFAPVHYIDTTITNTLAM